MLDIGWSEMAVIGLVALLVIGPKDLPRVMRTMGKWAHKARAVSREFQSGIDEMIRESELEDARKALNQTRGGGLDKLVENTIDPTGSVKETAREIESSARSEDPDAETAEAKAAEPAELPDAAEKPAQASEVNATAEAEAAAPRATIIKQPTQIAPPHSVRPPDEPGSPAETAGAKPEVADAPGAKSA
jgi:sec-independent protein translocase protein TatB